MIMCTWENIDAHQGKVLFEHLRLSRSMHFAFPFFEEFIMLKDQTPASLQQGAFLENTYYSNL